jgi:UTP:GlnB (protein PII) uridylyltransferase
VTLLLLWQEYRQTQPEGYGYSRFCELYQRWAGTLDPVLRQAYTGEKIATQIRLDNEDSESRTLIEIETEDRIGLLYTISQTLTELTLDISAAKICTERGAALDSFYVREAHSGKVLAPERHRSIEHRLRHAIDALDAR